MPLMVKTLLKSNGKLAEVELDVEALLGPLLGNLKAPLERFQRTPEEVTTALGQLYTAPMEAAVQPRCCWVFPKNPGITCSEAVDHRVMHTAQCVGFLCRDHARVWPHGDKLKLDPPYTDAPAAAPEPAVAVNSGLAPHQVPPHLRIVPGLRQDAGTMPGPGRE